MGSTLGSPFATRHVLSRAFSLPTVAALGSLQPRTLAILAQSLRRAFRRSRSRIDACPHANSFQHSCRIAPRTTVTPRSRLKFSLHGRVDDDLLPADIDNLTFSTLASTLPSPHSSHPSPARNLPESVASEDTLLLALSLARMSIHGDIVRPVAVNTFSSATHTSRATSPNMAAVAALHRPLSTIDSTDH